jgi:hypothetical protein
MRSPWRFDTIVPGVSKGQGSADVRRAAEISPAGIPARSAVQLLDSARVVTPAAMRTRAQ